MLAGHGFSQVDHLLAIAKQVDDLITLVAFVIKLTRDICNC